MSDTWSSIQAHKKQLDSLRERLQRRRKQDPLGTDPRHDLATPPRTGSPAPSGPAPSGPTPGGVTTLGPPPEPDPALERRLLLHLSDLATPLPADARAIRDAIAGRTWDTPGTQLGEGDTHLGHTWGEGTHLGGEGTHLGGGDTPGTHLGGRGHTWDTPGGEGTHLGHT
uniref:Uncharacterized protein n=1 Tax=Catharus ustulatus TaxID=91951 RepID=A0A8C3Y707_CATUS